MAVEPERVHNVMTISMKLRLNSRNVTLCMSYKKTEFLKNKPKKLYSKVHIYSGTQVTKAKYCTVQVGHKLNMMQRSQLMSSLFPLKMLFRNWGASQAHIF